MNSAVKTIVLAAALGMTMGATAQVKIPKGANRFVYYQLEHGDRIDTTLVTIDCTPDGRAIISTPRPEGRLIEGYAQTVTEADYAADSITVVASYPDTAYYYRTPFSRDDIEWSISGDVYTCHINSNRMEFEMDSRTACNANPLPFYGLNRGVLRCFSRNGQTRLVLARAERVKGTVAADTYSKLPLQRVAPRDMDRIMKERLVVSTRVFDHVQLHWGETNAHVEGGLEAVPFDTVLHYAGGTMVLKRIVLPDLPPHYQHFVEIHQQSNGDAYDRTGSLFVVPMGEHTFFDGINQHPDSLPCYVARDGQKYQGMMATGDFAPPVELVRFFTPFGVGHFNERMRGYGIDWRDEAYYRQEITDLYRYSLNGTVWIGAWIGNYDGGGHLLTVDIKSYPNDYSAATADDENLEQGEVMPLFNTCNVLEMAGQNYGKLFATDSLTVRFTIPSTAQGAHLRYISTGHGGWGEGDEFVPKTNILLIDGQPAFSHTPWRGDCGTYRDLNPVSGNFWNGISSSDLSRSGWCPGTATQPIYFDFAPWADGQEHTLTLAIPQGQPVEAMFSHWAVSGALIIEY